ncbi:MAG TPA: MoaD/ThiS family protein [Candidatus Limnocylindrales bacterium]|nr:MoaD/ThiS family protein [Candidatus Limnocylindrales bacterium]
MEITVVLYATLTRYHPQQGRQSEPFTVKLPEGSSVQDLLGHLGIKEGEAKQIFIKHQSRPRDFILADGERVAIFPPIAGG